MSYPVREGNTGNTAGSTWNSATSTAPATGTSATRGPIDRGVDNIERVAGFSPGHNTTSSTAGTDTGVRTGYETGATTAQAPTAGAPGGGIGTTARAPVGQRLAGSVEKAAGRVTNDPNLIIRGEEKKTGTHVSTGGVGTSGVGTDPGNA